MLRNACAIVLLLSAAPSSALFDADTAVRDVAALFALQGRDQPSSPALMAAARAQIDAQQAAAAVQKRYRGKILSVKLIDSKGPPVYRVKTITPRGVVKVVFVDALTGDVFE